MFSIRCKRLHIPIRSFHLWLSQASPRQTFRHPPSTPRIPQTPMDNLPSISHIKDNPLPPPIPEDRINTTAVSTSTLQRLSAAKALAPTEEISPYPSTVDELYEHLSTRCHDVDSVLNIDCRELKSSSRLLVLQRLTELVSNGDYPLASLRNDVRFYLILYQTTLSARFLFRSQLIGLAKCLRPLGLSLQDKPVLVTLRLINHSMNEMPVDELMRILDHTFLLALHSSLGQDLQSDNTADKLFECHPETWAMFQQAFIHTCQRLEELPSVSIVTQWRLLKYFGYLFSPKILHRVEDNLVDSMQSLPQLMVEKRQNDEAIMFFMRTLTTLFTEGLLYCPPQFRVRFHEVLCSMSRDVMKEFSVHILPVYVSEAVLLQTVLEKVRLWQQKYHEFSLPHEQQQIADWTKAADDFCNQIVPLLAKC